MTTAAFTPHLNFVEREWLKPQVERAATTRALSRRVFTSVYPWLTLIAAGQFTVALWPHRYNHSPFEDEGLYVYEGHRIIAHVLHGARITEYPGSYFSGAPGFYPVLAAVGDYFGGINGARFVSLLLATVAMVGVYGIGSQLFGKAGGVVGAATFSLNGSVIYLSHWATYDSTMMAFVSLAIWAGIASAKRDGLLWTPFIAVLMTLAFLAKYAAAVYLPVLCLVVASVGWPRYRWLAIRQAVVLALVSIAMTFSVLCLIGRSMFGGIESTTFSRRILTYGSTRQMLHFFELWVGPWYVVGVAAAAFLVISRTQNWHLILVLAFGSIIGVADQIHIHELTSFNKHVAFGLVFLCPLIGGMVVTSFTYSNNARRRWLRFSTVALAKLVTTVAVVTVTLCYLQPSGWRNSKVFLTSWTQDQTLVPVLETYYRQFPNKHILGDAPSPERYAMRNLVKVGLWNDNYVLYYKNRVGVDAYRLAVSDDHFGVIYLTNASPNSRFVQRLINQGIGNYVLRSKIPRYLGDRMVGYWLVYTLRTPTLDA